MNDPTVSPQYDNPRAYNSYVYNSRVAQLGLLVYLLQLLHVLFGITAVIGMLVNHTLQHRVVGSYIESHFSWQKLTFWLLAPAYLAAFVFWSQSGQSWAIFLVLAIALYRVARGWWQLHLKKPIGVLW